MSLVKSAVKYQKVMVHDCQGATNDTYYTELSGAERTAVLFPHVFFKLSMKERPWPVTFFGHGHLGFFTSTKSVLFRWVDIENRKKVIGFHSTDSGPFPFFLPVWAHIRPGFPKRQLQVRLQDRLLLPRHWLHQQVLQRHDPRGGIRKDPRGKMIAGLSASKANWGSKKIGKLVQDCRRMENELETYPAAHSSNAPATYLPSN